VLWRDFSERGIHEMAVKTKALTRAYYGRDARYAYWNGFSTGGRQGHKEAQAHPEDFDGILAGAPAFNWTKFITAELYPQIVMQRDLAGTPLTAAQLDMLGNAAIGACDVVGGEHLGYIPNPSICRYDPVTDPSVLCTANGGVNDSDTCVTPVQATAMNKMWYGQTTDGSVPQPTTDLGFEIAPTGKQRWYGLTRGTSMSRLAGPTPFTISTDMVALESQMPSLATPSFINATGNGADGWRNLSYEQLSQLWAQGEVLQTQFADINTDNPDLSAFRDRNGKMIMYHGLSDTLIPPQGSINYYIRVAAQMGDVLSIQSFYRFYLVPGMGHGFSNGTTRQDVNPPLPTNEQLYGLLTNWVENGVPPGRLDITSTGAAGAAATSRPICVYPQEATYIAGDPKIAASYTCS
jgi:feruloyl esterase